MAGKEFVFERITFKMQRQHAARRRFGVLGEPSPMTCYWCGRSSPVWWFWQRRKGQATAEQRYACTRCRKAHAE